MAAIWECARYGLHLLAGLTLLLVGLGHSKELVDLGTQQDWTLVPSLMRPGLELLSSQNHGKAIKSNEILCISHSNHLNPCMRYAGSSLILTPSWSAPPMLHPACTYWWRSSTYSPLPLSNIECRS